MRGPTSPRFNSFKLNRIPSKTGAAMNKNLTMVMTFATENKVPTVAGDNLNSSVVDDMISILRKIVEIVENSNFYKTKLYSKSDQEIPENSVRP